MRSIAVRLRAFVGNRRRARRYQARLPFSVSLLDAKGSPVEGRRPSALGGYTRDISATGLALIVPAIRIGERYLTDQRQILRIALETPAGPLQIDVAPVRYERLEDETETGYLVGVSIKEMSDHDRAKFAECLDIVRQGRKAVQTATERGALT